MTDRDVIMVGVDYSECSRRAVDWAVQEALRSRRQLRLVHVTHWLDDSIAAGPVQPSNVHAHKAASRLLQRYALEARHEGVAEARIRVLEGDPASVLPDAARDADMLVVGSHGRGPVKAAILGTVSGACVRHAVCPVVVIPASATPSRGSTRSAQAVAR